MWVWGAHALIEAEGFAVALANSKLPGRYTPIGSVIAATDKLESLKPTDALRSLRIYRVGEEAKAFKAAGAKTDGGE